MSGYLTHTLSSSSPASFHRLALVALDIARGVRHLHRSGIIHRDLAARNVLVRGNGNNNTKTQTRKDTKIHDTQHMTHDTHETERETEVVPVPVIAFT